jgi:hypothetical protein
MKALASVAFATLVTACSTVPTTSMDSADAKGSTRTASSASSASGEMYCWKDKLMTEGSELRCNWSANRKEACETKYSSSISRDKLTAEPQDAGRCANGQWLVKVTAR